MKAMFVVFAIFAIYICTVHSNLRVECPKDSDKDYELIPNPCNCSAYYVCQGDYAIPMPCPLNLHFNNAKKQCDYKNKAHCKEDPACPKLAH